MSPPSPCNLVSKEPFSSKRNQGSLGKQLMIPALKHKEDPKKSGTSCYFRNKGNGLPLPPPGDLPHPGIEPTSASAALVDRFFTTEPPGKPYFCIGSDAE